jgi:hypothetical protein
MLTKSEKEWMENRGKFSCWYCPNTPQVMCTMGERPAHCAIMDTDWKEAAEFSERVAAELAEMAQYNIKFGCDACPAYIDDAVPCKPYCAALLLKTARLQVEEEMDAENE